MKRMENIEQTKRTWSEREGKTESYIWERGARGRKTRKRTNVRSKENDGKRKEREGEGK